MVLTKSTMLELGTKAPEFNLPDVTSGKRVSLSDFADKKSLLVMFVCCHCPFVEHVQKELAKIGKDYENKNFGIVAISSNDMETHPDDSPENLKRQAEELGFNFPYCHDKTQEVAKSYTAACTPDFFLFDKERKLVYRGQLDDSRPGSLKPVTGKDLREAINSVLADKSVNQEQRPSAGCNIKWKTGNEPAYY
ncbi:thioredoxin family protein [Candidatus Woesebacteria bacterium]|nr:thioredoxin family protein [Candidatus Woesebacteria bacterium]